MLRRVGYSRNHDGCSVTQGPRPARRPGELLHVVDMKKDGRFVVETRIFQDAARRIPGR